MREQEENKAEEMMLSQQVLIRLPSVFCEVSRDILQYYRPSLAQLVWVFRNSCW